MSEVAMNVIMLLMAGLALYIFVAAFQRYRREELARSGRSIGDTLQACDAMLGLIGLMQQHRGMSSAWLAGDRSFAARLESKRREIDNAIPALRDLARREGGQVHPCLTRNELDLFQFNWAQLLEKQAGLSVEQNIAQHSFLIEQLLQWLSAVGEARIESLLDTADMRAWGRNYAHRLPALTECLGQARALGMSVAARHACSAVSRVRLMFLVARAEALLAQAGDAAGRGPEAVAATQAVQQMVRVIRTQMLLSSGISIVAQDFFQIATSAIDGVFAWIDQSGRALRRASECGEHDQYNSTLQRT